MFCFLDQLCILNKWCDCTNYFENLTQKRLIFTKFQLNPTLWKVPEAQWWHDKVSPQLSYSQDWISDFHWETMSKVWWLYYWIVVSQTHRLTSQVISVLSPGHTGHSLAILGRSENQWLGAARAPLEAGVTGSNDKNEIIEPKSHLCDNETLTPGEETQPPRPSPHSPSPRFLQIVTALFRWAVLLVSWHPVDQVLHYFPPPHVRHAGDLADIWQWWTPPCIIAPALCPA